jgi:hypothetical protein
MLRTAGEEICKCEHNKRTSAYVSERSAAVWTNKSGITSTRMRLPCFRHFWQRRDYEKAALSRQCLSGAPVQRRCDGRRGKRLSQYSGPACRNRSIRFSGATGIPLCTSSRGGTLPVQMDRCPQPHCRLTLPAPGSRINREIPLLRRKTPRSRIAQEAPGIADRHPEGGEKR